MESESEESERFISSYSVYDSVTYDLYLHL